MLRLLITTWLELAIVETLSLPEQAYRCLWLFPMNGTAPAR
jgi:hypothetical protein